MEVLVENLESSLVILIGFLNSILLQAFSARLSQIMHSFLEEIFLGEIAMPEMESQNFIKFRQPAAQHLLNPQTDAPMHDLAISLEQAVINHVLNHGVFKNIILLFLRSTAQQVK